MPSQSTNTRVTQALPLGLLQALGTSVGTPLPMPPTEDQAPRLREGSYQRHPVTQMTVFPGEPETGTGSPFLEPAFNRNNKNTHHTRNLIRNFGLHLLTATQFHTTEQEDSFPSRVWRTIPQACTLALAGWAERDWAPPRPLG